jgi:hypothetical protein
MKADHLEGLPAKRIYLRPRQMPPRQASIYAEIVTRAKQPEAGPMLETLHLLRGISLHPTWPPAGEIADPNGFIAESARLIETFTILDEISQRREKVLIFLESLELQEHLAIIIKERYRLKRLPMKINGEISGEKRQQFVDAFQAERGSFDVMILSPRAGGVGLTLTAANHVVHLSRWWNPAVEDQCTDRIYRIGQDQVVHVYYPMALHPHYGESSFDGLLNTLLTTKRALSQRLLMPPVNLERDQQWFADNLGRGSLAVEIEHASIEDIDAMEPRSFENWAIRRTIKFGWNGFATPRSHDGGADGVLVHAKTSSKAIIQCKHRQAKGAVCGVEAIDDLLRARSRYGAIDRCFVLTNAPEFSRAAQESAARYNIILVGRDQLADWPRPLL